MIPKFIEISEHKVFTFRIIESPTFVCIFQQLYPDSIDDFRHGVTGEKDCGITMALNFSEFSAVADEILSYKKELESSGKIIKDLADKKESVKK